MCIDGSELKGSANPWNGVAAIPIAGTPFGSVASILLKDINGDGYLDYLVAVRNGSKTLLFLNNKSSNPWNGVSPISITADEHDTLFLVTADFDGDGDIDVVAANFGQSETNRFYANGGFNP